MMHQIDVAGLPSIDHNLNIERYLTAIAERELNAAIVSSTPNKVWLLGFEGAGQIVVTRDAVTLLTDPRYAERAVAELDEARVEATVRVCRTQAQVFDVIVELCARFDTVGAEGNRLTFDEYEALAARLSLTTTSGLAENLRRHKQAAEVARIDAAARCAADALSTVAPSLQGMTEREIAAELDYQMRRRGANAPAYDTIVASGPQHAARPHHAPGDRTVIEGDTVIIDVGAEVDGYRSDMTRTFIIGDPTTQQRLRYQAVVEAQAAGRIAVHPGVRGDAVDAACRERLDQDDLADLFIHGVGHGVGLEIHEPPFLGATSTDNLRIGDVITIEPGVYEDGFGGVRIEDVGVVNADGFDTLSIAPYGMGAQD